VDRRKEWGGMERGGRKISRDWNKRSISGEERGIEGRSPLPGLLSTYVL
jgi:hypothetical protein